MKPDGENIEVTVKRIVDVYKRQKLTNGIIEHKLKEHNMLTKVKRKVVKYGQHINLSLIHI